MVPPSRQVVVPDPAYQPTIQITFLLKASLIKQRFSPLFQRASQPIGDRNGKPLLGPLYELSRNMPIQDFTKQPLSFSIANLHMQRHAPSQFEHAMVYQWNPGFQAVSHRCSVYLHQNVVRHVALNIHGHHPVLERVHPWPSFWSIQ